MRRLDLLDDFAILLVDDHPLFRDGLTAALRHHVPGLRVHAVGTMASALEMLGSAGDKFDLVLLDYRLPGTDGLYCAELLIQQYPGIAVGLMSGLDDPTLPERAREAGLIAYLSKSLEISSLIEHLRRLAMGEPVFSAPDPPQQAFDATRADPMNLTARQLDVLRAMASGSSNKEIARTMGISPATVKKHLEAVFAKLGATNRLQAAMLARTVLGDPPP
ncbi:LuxR C-terminal-related transcriptional regulator [Ottowia thiooxydans]|uniref:response regulator transcription factor n=1 Tax=Ottowia thiooxydans TaxID=219182 RepID=UPI00048D1AA1|nr:response regulator transcription factor [Ottowia thiooxydans]